MNSTLYYDIDLQSAVNAQLIHRVQEYTINHKMDIFIFNVPKSDLKKGEYEHEGCFIVMSAGHKLALINAGVDQDEYDDYVEDVNVLINYLFSKYDYRSELGRFSKWGSSLIKDGLSIRDMDNLEEFWERLRVTDRLEMRKTELLVALCSGSINDIERVKAGLPQTMLEQVKQRIQAFDADQTRFIYQELNQKIVKIQGLSGTGKTELLLHKLKELYQKPEKYKIYVTCHNKILADSLQNRIPLFFNFMKVTQQIEWGKRLWCTNAWGSGLDSNSGLYRFICEHYQLTYRPYHYSITFDDVCKTAIRELKTKFAGRDIPPVLDYVIIDECQDFKDDFFVLCQMVTSQKVYIAGDIFQSIFAEYSGRDYQADFFLSRCYRTDERTLMFAHALGLGLFEENRLRWLNQQDWEACGYNYRLNEQNDCIVLNREPVHRFVEANGAYQSIEIKGFEGKKSYEAICDQIDAIRQEHPTCTEEDICVILLDSDQEIYSLALYLESVVMDRFGWRVNKAYENKKKIANTLLISNRNNVKGLEYPFVICVTRHVSDGYVYRNALYTMLTRSFLKSILLLPNPDLDISANVRAGYDEIMATSKMTIHIPSEPERQQIETRFNAAKRRKPTIEIIRDCVETMNLEDPIAEKLLKHALSFNWEDSSDEEIKEKIKTLRSIL